MKYGKIYQVYLLVADCDAIKLTKRSEYDGDIKCTICQKNFLPNFKNLANFVLIATFFCTDDGSCWASVSCTSVSGHGIGWQID